MKALLKKLTVGEHADTSGATKKQTAPKKPASRWSPVTGFARRHWVGTVVILAATLLFFWPVVTRLDSYSEGGDAMFNAWTLSRNHHCIMRDNCEQYTDGNIYFPHQDSMLYSETQTSAGLLTLPLYWLNDNPIFSYNVWTIASFFLSGWFMYFLARYISRGNVLFAVLAGLIFAFAPFKIAAISHLQNLSIFYLPLALLLILKFWETSHRRYLVGLLPVLTLQFYASWYQMAFVLIALGVLLVGAKLVKLINWRQLAAVGAVTALAVMATLPLALEYMRFSKANDASFSIGEQIKYSSSVADYVLPDGLTALAKMYHAAFPQAHYGSYNLDSTSFHGYVLYAVAIGLAIAAYRLYRSKKAGAMSDANKWVVVFLLIALVGFVVSLGPLLKIFGAYTYGTLPDGSQAVVPAPWILVDKFLPQLTFIRALGRASVLVLLALCCLLALLPRYAEALRIKPLHKKILFGAITVAVIVELLPIRTAPMVSHSFAYNLQVPAVYKFIKGRPEIDKFVILNADRDYPGATIPFARAEWVLWAGYHNKYIFNGYSGYTPPKYFEQYDDFVDFKSDDIPKMKQLGLRYVLVDKQLSSSKPQLIKAVRAALPDRVYSDDRYELFRLP